MFINRPSARKVENGREQHKHDINGFPPRIEKKAEKKEYGVFKAFRNDKVHQQYDGKKKQKKSQP